MSIPDQTTICCPYCGEATDVHVDIDGDADELVEDCTVCCRPLLLHVEYDEEGNPIVSAARESE